MSVCPFILPTHAPMLRLKLITRHLFHVQTALDGILSDVDQLHTLALRHSHKQTLSILSKNDVSMEVMTAVEASMENTQSSNLFSGLETEHKQNVFFRKHFGLIVSHFYGLFWCACNCSSFFLRNLLSVYWGG